VLNAPEPRYKIVEQGRRLIVIDTRDGKKFGVAQSQEEIAPPSPVPLSPRQSVSPWQSATNRSELRTESNHGRNRTTKIMVLVAGALVFLAFLILSGAWVPVVIALAIAPVRTFVLRAFRTAVERYLNG
jgi:hypothetical protein